MNKKYRRKRNFKYNKVGLMALDAFFVIVSMLVALLLRHNGLINIIYLERLARVGVLIIIFDIAIFYYKSFYHSLWEYASIQELTNIVIGTFLASVVNIVIFELTLNSMPRSCYVIFFMLITMLTGGYRFIYRYIVNDMLRKKNENKYTSHVMIVGAGNAGEIIAREIFASKEVNKKVVCFIDDDPNKKDSFLHNVIIYGNRNKIKEAVEKFNVDEIYVAIPSATSEQLIEILNICNETKKHTEILPGIFQLINKDIKLSDLKEVEIEDLLERSPIEVNLDEIMDYINYKTILITGGGGSIGSELCRQIAKNNPKKLLILDIYENNLYDIQIELKRDYPYLDLHALIASVRDEGKIDQVFQQFRPDIVYHAAAHKHVPLMEDAPNEAVKNNVFGTYNVAEACYKYGVEKMVLISTDKAVNPTNIMGATKRICEMIVQAFANKSTKTEFVAVRFGNVLGSSGSVVNLFKQQIAKGGPVTVTDPNIIRYFMTIPEAVSLVLQAGYYAKGGEIFIFDMGKPVKILDMAKKLIRLSGYEPDRDIKISFIGLRPGEKLYEEILMDEEGLQETPNHLIHIGKPIEMDYEKFFKQLVDLKKLAYEETESIKKAVQKIVPTYIEKGGS